MCCCKRRSRSVDNEQAVRICLYEGQYRSTVFHIRNAIVRTCYGIVTYLNVTIFAFSKSLCNWMGYAATRWTIPHVENSSLTYIVIHKEVYSSDTVLHKFFSMLLR
ncbi:uncharacterized protein LOC105666913 [Bombus terrestris]|uniref:Uncharacterized protein LOC105666913 n=1 Tax=Bombus terrestris TaxID=30195 RepID=A0A9C6SZR0_BOMTE|nr:uncharacterized protein LOC105666913 [Bombus terrestris]